MAGLATGAPESFLIHTNSSPGRDVAHRGARSRSSAGYPLDELPDMSARSVLYKILPGYKDVFYWRMNQKVG